MPKAFSKLYRTNSKKLWYIYISIHPPPPQVNYLKIQDQSQPEDDNIENIAFEQEELTQQIKEMQEVNKVIRFEVEVQKQANQRSEQEK